MLGCDPRLIKLFVETHMRNENRRKEMQQLVDNQTLKLLQVGFQHFFFLSYYFFLNLLTCFFSGKILYPIVGEIRR